MLTAVTQCDGVTTMFIVAFGARRSAPRMGMVVMFAIPAMPAFVVGAQGAYGGSSVMHHPVDAQYN